MPCSMSVTHVCVMAFSGRICNPPQCYIYLLKICVGRFRGGASLKKIIIQKLFGISAEIFFSVGDMLCHV